MQAFLLTLVTQRACPRIYDPMISFKGTSLLSEFTLSFASLALSRSGHSREMCPGVWHWNHSTLSFNFAFHRPWGSPDGPRFSSWQQSLTSPSHSSHPNWFKSLFRDIRIAIHVLHRKLVIIWCVVNRYLMDPPSHRFCIPWQLSGHWTG